MNSNGPRVNESAVNRLAVEREILCVPHGPCWSRSILSDLFLPAWAFVLVLVCSLVSVHVRTLMKTCPRWEITSNRPEYPPSFRFFGRFHPHYFWDSYKSFCRFHKVCAHFRNNILNQQKANDPTAKGGRRMNEIVYSPWGVCRPIRFDCRVLLLYRDVQSQSVNI